MTNPFDESTPTAPIVVVKRERRRSRIRDIATVLLFAYAIATSVRAHYLAVALDGADRIEPCVAARMHCGSRGCVEESEGKLGYCVDVDGHEVDWPYSIREGRFVR